MDLIICWPIGFDYPLWRKFIREQRKRFHRVIVIWTNNHNGKDLRTKVEEEMAKDDIAFMVAPPHNGDQDWRNTAVRHALGYSSSDWIWFTEQDFFVEDGFWDFIKKAIQEKCQLIYADDNGRMHPCSIFIQRSVLDLTSKDFSANPQEWDHFGKIQKDLEERPEPFLAKIIPGHLYYHMAGLTHNLRLKQDKKSIHYKPDEFKAYLEKINESTR